MKTAGYFLAVGLLGCAAIASAQYAAPADVAAPSNTTIPVPVPVYDTPIAAIAEHVGAFPESLEGNQALSLEARKDPENPARLVVVATLENLLDDAVSAQRYTIGLKPVADGWQRRSYKLESRCARAGDESDWKVGTCP